MAILVLILMLSVTLQVHCFCVDSTEGENAESCLQEEKQVCCKSLEFLVNHLKETENILIELAEVTLASVLYIEDFSNMTIQGQNEVKINCNTSVQSGIFFRDMENLELLNLKIQNCGMLQISSSLQQHNSDNNFQIWCAIYIICSTSIRIDDITIRGSKGIGLIMYDTDGNVTILNSTFEDNVGNTTYSGGGGLIIEFTNCSLEDCNKQIQNTAYVIQDSMFVGNYAYDNHQVKTSNINYQYGAYQVLGRGGGLLFSMRGESYGNTVHILNCKFINNTSTTWGGGLFLSLSDYSTKNNITIDNCDFINNDCSQIGGGGMKIALLSNQGVLSANEILIVNSNFTANRAHHHGGGVSFVATRVTELSQVADQLKNKIKFMNCTWHRNQAALASAVDISPEVWDVLGNGILPTINFEDCTFEENYITTNTTPIHEGITKAATGVGTLLISNFVVIFSELMTFTNNNGSGIHLQSGILELMSGTNLILTGNSAIRGGGMVFDGFSVMYITYGVQIEFRNNTARIKGGAVYAHSADQHERFTSRSCFVQAQEIGGRSSISNATIIFEGNRALSNAGNSIYASSLRPCGDTCILNITSPENDLSGFRCIGKLQGLTSEDITTHYDKFEYKNEKNGSILNEVIPGNYFKIPVKALDELNNNITMVYDISLKENNSIQLDYNSTIYVSNNTIRVHQCGQDQQNTILLTMDQVTISVNITTIECPPGHTLKGYDICLCDTSKFTGIWKCDSNQNIASILYGNWIGLCNDSSAEQCTGHCPIGFCTDEVSTDLTMRIRDTHTVLCQNNREGRLCGKCRANNSVYFHSHVYRCGDESLCNYGILLYVLSEILPLTIIFIVIIMFNVSFTTGATNGIILYAQIFDSFIMNYSYFPKSINVLTESFMFIYTLTNLNYFSIEKLSFCLWKGATTLDIIAWKYVTIVYALFLIIVTISLLNTTTCKKICICWRPHTLKNAVIHGFTAFLVMCYSQCANVSFRILTPTQLYAYNFAEKDLVIHYSGENDFFDKTHIKYGLPAILFLLIIVILPPMLLILYPLSFKILALCRLSELKIVNFISNIIPVQFFDSFQSCYKDNLRFFAGLYFFYRVIPLFLYAINTDMVTFYFSVEVFLIIALLLNATLQPYKENWHNITDSLIFANLALINGISLYNYQKINEGKDNWNKTKTAVTVSTAFQLVLIYLPLIYISICAIHYMLKWSRKKFRDRKISKMDYSIETLLDSTYLPPLRDENDITETDMDGQQYHKMK